MVYTFRVGSARRIPCKNPHRSWQDDSTTPRPAPQNRSPGHDDHRSPAGHQTCWSLRGNSPSRRYRRIDGFRLRGRHSRPRRERPNGQVASRAAADQNGQICRQPPSRAIQVPAVPRHMQIQEPGDPVARARQQHRSIRICRIADVAVMHSYPPARRAWRCVTGSGLASSSPN